MLLRWRLAVCMTKDLDCRREGSALVWLMLLTQLPKAPGQPGFACRSHTADPSPEYATTSHYAYGDASSPYRRPSHRPGRKRAAPCTARASRRLSRCRPSSQVCSRFSAAAGPSGIMRAARIRPRPAPIPLRGHVGSRGDLGRAWQRCLQDDGCPASGEQRSLLFDGDRGPMKGRCCHNPPRLACALRRHEGQSRTEESQSRLHADKERPFAVQTLRPTR